MQQKRECSDITKRPAISGRKFAAIGLKSVEPTLRGHYYCNSRNDWRSPRSTHDHWLRSDCLDLDFGASRAWSVDPSQVFLVPSRLHLVSFTTASACRMTRCAPVVQAPFVSVSLPHVPEPTNAASLRLKASSSRSRISLSHFIPSSSAASRINS